MTPPQKCCVAKWKAALLGGFVCWQLFYLFATNALQFVPIRVPADPGDALLNLQSVGRFTTDDRLQTLADAAGAGLARYSEVSGQIQFWKLFTPEFPPHTIVLVTRAEFRDGRVADVVSDYAPPEEVPAVRVPRRDVRPFQFEACTGLGPWAVTEVMIVRDHETARVLSVGWAGNRSRAVRVVMLNHWNRYKAQHPDEPDPVVLSLIVRFVAKPAWGAARSDTPTVTDRPFVRWSNPFGPYPSLDAFDPVAGGFVRIPEDRP
jgi:hypothetical protein